MISYPNQNFIIVNIAEVKKLSEKEKKEGKIQAPYCCWYKDDMYQAMQDLSATAFKVWCYFSSNQDDHSFGVSEKDIANKCKIGRSTVYTAFNELQEKGYLERDSKCWQFYNTLDYGKARNGRRIIKEED